MMQSEYDELHPVRFADGKFGSIGDADMLDHGFESEDDRNAQADDRDRKLK